LPKVTKSADCGNSPKNLLVQALAIALETANGAAFARCTSEDVVWAVPGRRSFQGRTAALARLRSKQPDSARIVVRHIVSHGRGGAAEGLLIDESGLSHGFCHVMEFANAKGDRVSAIFSYYSDIGEID